MQRALSVPGDATDGRSRIQHADAGIVVEGLLHCIMH